MRITRIDEERKYVVSYQGRAYWFDSIEDAEQFMRTIEDRLLYL